MAHSHNIYDSDMHFTINAETRKIINQTNKSKLIQGDHNSEHIVFEMPRYVDGHDMSLCSKVEVHYINIQADKAEQNKDVYIVNDVQISPDDENIVTFSWLISGNATKYAGLLTFAVRFVCLTELEVDYVWNTSIFSGITVESGMNNGEAVVIEYSDVLEAWKQETINAVLGALPIAEEGAF